MNEAVYHERATQLFLAACELPESERSAFLDKQCAAEPGLKADVEAMLREDSERPRFLETPALGEGFDVKPAEDGTASEQATERMPSRIGHFNVLEVLGEGGMGIVYLAEQDNPRRRVALKVIRPGMASMAMSRRFGHEAHILGRLQHPGIAQIYDAGLAETDGGRRPYFAMEYVKGLPLTEYAETHDLGTRDRLMLMSKVCDAVHHAHQKGVIHRDLKPGNILVDESGQPKILDFGVARATDSDVQATTMRTDVGQLIGTISYMSPEQIEGNPDALDTRSDVYALGVICYRLLTGRLPYHLGNKVIHEAARVICDDDPTPMSAVKRIFRGDVETIVHKALEKDRERRYQSASDLGADITHYVRYEPIIARPASAAYQLRKFARRNRALVTALVAVFIALVIGVTATSWALAQANRQRNHAEANLKRALQAEELAQQRLRETEAARAEETRLRELAEQRYKDADDARAVEREVRRKAITSINKDLHEVLAEQPALEASTYYLLGTGLKDLHDLDSAAPFLVASAEVRRKELGNEDEKTLESLTALANLRADQEFGNSGETPEERERARKLRGEAVRLFREIYETSARTLGPEDPKTLGRRSDLATMLPLAEAEPIHRENLAILRRTIGPSEPQTVSAQLNLAYTLTTLGRHSEAVAEYREVLAVREKRYPPEDQRLATVLMCLARSLEEIGDYGAAIEAQRRAVSGLRRAHGDQDPRVLMRWQRLAGLMQKAGRLARENGNEAASSTWFAEAAQTYALVLAGRRSALGSRHGNTLVTISSFGMLRQDQGDYAASEELFKELIPSSEAALPKDHWHRAYFKSNYANLLIAMKRFEEAERLLLFAHPRLLELKGPDSNHTKKALERLVTLYTKWGKTKEAAKYRAVLSIKSQE